MKTSYGFGKTVNYSFLEAIDKVTEALAKEGFGILTEIDVAATMKKKLDKNMRPYRILGACNPHLAHRALSSENSIGLLLPCNVVVREDDAEHVNVEFLDPDMMQELSGDAEVEAVAIEAKERLVRVMQSL